MKDKTRLAITGVAALLALAVTLGGHGLNFEFGDDGAEEAGGNPETSRALGDLKDFQAVALTGPDNVVIKRGTAFSVQVEGGGDVLDRLDLQVRDGTLHVGRKRSSLMGGADDGSATVHVTLPALNRVSLAGSGEMSVERLEGSQVKAELTGPGNLVIDGLVADKAELSITGSGDLTATGRAKQASLSATGSGNVRAEALDTEQASLKLVGSGDIAVHASRGADISIMGSGDAQVVGTTACKLSRTGPGEARCTAG